MKRIIVWITVLTLIVTGVFAMNACGKRTDKDGISYQLNVSNFDGITTYGEPMDLSRITITRTENGVSTEVPVEASMVTSRVDTSKPGAHILKFNYSGQSFNLPVIVKYKLQFLVDGDVYQSIHVLNRAELGEVAHPEKPGYNFVGWSTEIPGVIADNMTFHAVYEPIIPTLSEIQATYGDNLEAINLPYSVIGQWKFDAPEGTVGNVGKHTFPVSFVEYATGAVLATDTVAVNVAKKTVVFSDVVESFAYNGMVQKPTFKTDVVPQEDEKFEIIFFETPGANYTDVGTYDYYFEVDADNYEGTLVGTYEITRVAITIQINSYEMVAGDAYPTVEYQLLGIGDADAETVARLIGLSVTQPEDIVAGAGVYTLTATASNPNVILNVQEGTLTVQSTVLDVADPIFEKEFAIYEDILADVLFKDNQNGNGTWSWKYPDALVGNVGIQEHIAVFTPYNTDKYDIIERTVQVKVEKKELIIEIVGKKEFDYNGQEHTLSYIIKDANGKQYASFTVLENPAYTNAGEYSITLKFEHQSYEASDVTEKLTIKKINPDTVFGKVDLTAVWNPNLTLAQITLPTSAMGQYTWVVEGNQTPGDIALSAGSKSYTAVFTPYDAYKTNYNSVSGEFTLQIEQATAKIEGVKDHYNFTYNKNAFVLEGITTNHTVSELAVEYKLNGQKVDSILNAGEYVVTFTLPETANYKEAVVTATVTVAKADAGKPTVGTAAFGDLLLNAVKFPENSEGNWTILLDAGTNADENTKVGSVGEHKFVAVFTPTTENYNRSEVEITVNVAKKKIDVPQISGTNKSQVYTGALLNSGLISGEGYTVEDIGGTAVGTYKAKVVLDTTSYEWNDPNVQSTFEAEYSITPATNAWTAQPAINSWVYGQAGNNGSASAMLGDVTIEYKLASAADTAYTTARPTNAGAYIARFTVVYANYFDLVQTCAFTIEKQTVNAPEYTKNYIYSGSPITVDIPTSTLYNIANHINTDVREGGYLASLTLTDSANYQWSNSESATITLAYTIGKANIVISNFSIVGWTYGQLANAPTYDVTFKDYTEVTYEYFDKDYNSIGATAPRNAGTYYVKATAAGNTNLNGYTTDFAQFTIAKAGVSIDGVNDSYTETYNGVAFTITGVKASNGATVTKVITKKGVDGTVNAIIGVGEYTITYTVAEAPNYLGTERTVKVTIQQADVTISKPVIEGWTYGDGAKTPTANFNETFAYGQIIFRYFTDADCKNEITDLTNAGTYYVKAIFAGNDDLNAAESAATAFVVAQKVVTVPTVSNKPYNGQNQTSGLTAAEGYTVVDNGGTNVGPYTATVTLVSANYIWKDGTSAAKELVYNITSIDNTQEFEKTSYTATYGDLLKDIVKLPANVQGTWSIEDATEATTVGNAGTRTFKAIFTPDEAGNYNKRTVEITIVVAKKTVVVPTNYTVEYVYTGSDITANIPTSTLYTIANHVAKSVGDYNATLALADSANYVWSNGDTLNTTVPYSIIRADVTISKPVIDGWTYGDGAKTPVASFNEAFAYGQISFKYFTDADCKNEITDLTNAGTYYVKAIFAGNDDLNAAESEATAFVVAQKVVTVPTVSNKPYNGQNQTAGLTAAEGYTVVDNGGTNVGPYTATVTLVSTNYIWKDGTSAAKELVYNITSIDNTQEFEKTSYTATYGDLLKDIVKLPANVQGTWSIEGATEATTVGNAGTRTFKAIFTPDEAGNYNKRTVEITIVVAKKTVEKPIINPKEYTGEHLYSGLTTNAIYTVVDNGGVDHDEYDVVLTLVDANNYKWEDTEDASITLKFVISTAVNAWVEGKLPTISSWEYESEGDHAGKATAMHGGVLIEYKLVTDPESAYSPELPSVPGDYIARFTTTDDNYNILTETKKFSITKRVITPPTQTQTSFVYSGSLIKSDLSDGTGYAVIADEGRIDVGSFTATISLTSEHYVWNDGTTADKTFTYSITPATNTQDITVEYTATYGDLLKDIITLSTGIQGTWSIEGATEATTVGNAGKQTFKAIFTPDEVGNYNRREETITITVAKKSVPIPEVTKQEGIEYTGNKVASGLTDTELYTVIDIGGVAVGTHQVQLTLKDKANYKWQDGDSNDLYIDYVVIVKAQNRDTIPTYTATYGDSVATLTLPTSTTGSWKWQTITEVGTVGGENKHVLVFTPSDAAKYADRTVTVTITVNPKPVSAPTGIPEANRNQVYTGEELFSGLTAGEGYTVTEATNPVNKGEYEVTVQLKNKNYVWADGTSEAKTFTYNITPATNTEEITLTYTATYGDLLKDIITLPTGIQGTWSIEGATEATTVGNAGKQTFKAIFTPDEVGNYNRREETITITVAKKVVNVPTEYTKEYTYTGSDITVVIPVESGLYTASDNVAKNFGSYNATLTLTDSANYKWATTDAATTTVPYSIGKADVAVSITINGWTYGQAANAPVVSISKEFVGDVPYIVEYSEDGIAWSTSVPTDAGSYTVRVTVEENANYQVTAESVTEATFTIAKISTSITANETYTFTYNGSAYTTQALNIPVPYTGAPALKYTYEDGSAFTGVTNAGEYKVVITLAETDTHKGATVTVTVKVDKANVTVSTPSIEGWTYNQTAKNPSAIVTYKDVNGNDITFEATLSFVYANSIDGEYNATVPTDAGIYYVKAVFAGNDNLNGAESEAQSFTIAKIVVPVPSIANKDYNGQVQYSGLVSDIYTVTEAENPLNKGEYTVTLTLNAPANYAWTSTDNTSATATATYSILPVENTISVNIGNNAQWQYGTAEDVVNGYITVDVKYGGWTVVYRALGSTGEYTEGLPTKKGSYELKFTTTDTNCSIVSATRSVEILATSVAVPSIGNLTYNTTLQKPTVPTGLYTVVNNGGTNVGEYTVTLKLLDTDSSYWGEDVTDVADKTITYQITKATVTLSDLAISNWNYNETAGTPTVQINLPVPYYFEYFADGAWSKTAPTKAGSYKVRAVVDKTDNYDAVTTDGVAFTINQVTPTWSAPTFTGGKNGKYYLNQFVYPAANTLTATHANAADAANRTVPGTFNWGAPTFVANGGGYIELTFKPTDTVNYKTVTVKYDVNFVTVAVIGSTQYGSIESALAAAVSGNTVRVRIHDADLGPIYIKENVEVKSGITLLLPYGNGENDKNTYSNNIPQYTLHSGGCSSGKHGLSEGLATEAQCTLKVVVAEGVVITNRGTIEIAGLLSGGGSPHPYAGHTGGTHARLLLDAGARIENYGVIRAAGYIRELNKDNGSQVNVYSGATLYQPFVIMDYINGQYMAGAYKTMMNDAPDPVNAFNRFALTNVSPKVKVEYGGSIITWTALYTSTMESLDASKANNITSVTCVGTGGLLELSAGAYLEAKLDPDTLVTKLDIYGGAKTNSMEISVSFAEALGANVGFSFSTADCWFPLTYLFDIDLHSGTYTIGQDFKLMPGAKLTVAADAELIVNAKLIVYDQGTISSPSEEDGKFTDGRNGLVADGFLYPTTVAAVFTVNGKATIQELGGEVHSQTPGATVTITQGTYLEGNEAATYELGTLDGVVADMYVSIMEKVAGTDKLSQDVATRFIVKKNAVLINNDGSFVNPSLTTTYAYANGIWRQPVVHINFNVNGGNGVGSIGIPLDDGIYQSLPTPTRKHYTFVGWKDANGNLIANGTALPTGCVAGDTLSLTAEWIPTQYTIKYQGIDKDGNPIAWTMNDGVFTVVDSSFSLPTITPPTGYSHTGWKFNGKNIIALTIEECLAAVDAESRTITVQVVFETSDSIYTYNFNLGTAYIGLAYPTQNWSLGTYPNSTDHPELMKQITSDSNGVNYKTSTEKEFYFEGWYTDAGFTRAYTENYEPTDEEKASKTITLYAKWTQKFKVICKNGDVVEGEYYVDPSNAVYPTLPTPTLTGYTFAGWYYGETPVATGRFVESTEAHTLTAEWTLNSYTITVTKLSNATIKVNGTSVALNGTVSVPYGSEVTVTVTFSKSTKSMNIKDANKKSLVSTSNAGDHKFTMPASNVTIEAESSDGCFTPDTLITLANGTQKRVDELTAGDKILAWDFFTGTYVAKDISLLVNHGEDLYRIANLVFSDGTTLRIIAEHGVFDYDLNKYVYFSVDNMEEYIGHRFVQYAADGTYNIVTLVDAYETEEYTSAWSVSSAVTSNAFAAGLLTVAPPEDFYNWIEMDGKLMYNVEQFQQDVATYGLYTYEDFKDYVTYDQFIEWNGAYLKVAVEKGYFTFEYILELIELYKGWMPNN